MICPRCGTALTLPDQGTTISDTSAPTVFGPLRESVTPPEVSLTEAPKSNPALEGQLKGGTNYGIQGMQPPSSYLSSPTYLATDTTPIYPMGTNISPLPPPIETGGSRPLTQPPPMQAGNFYPMAPQPTPAAFTPRPPAPRPSPLSRPMLLLLGAVALLLVLSGVSLIFYTTVIHPAQLRAEATATVQAAFTQDARGTATAQALANVTATAQAQATATAFAQATVQAQATATALQAIYTQATSSSPSLVSSLAYQDGNNWDAYDTTDGGGCHFINGALHASVYTKNYYVPCLALNSNYSNFAFQVQMTITQGDAGGLLFRASSDNVREYLFRVWSNGDYDLYVYKDNNNSLPLIRDHSAAIKTGSGQANILTVIMRGSTIYLYINQQYLGSASDSTLSAGSVGVFADDHSSNTDVAFTNAKAWSL